SKFSPWLANGSLSPRLIYSEVKKYEGERAVNDSTYWMTFELLWRDYFKFHALKYGPFLFRLEGLSESAQRPLDERLQQELFKSWKSGNTGTDFIDANMKEINETGFMSNKGRQAVARYLTQTLRVDWRWGARYFEEMLIDYDAASNWGNWNYVASLTEHSNPSVDPEGDYIRHWLGSTHSGSPL
ncbi:MAG: hypothetical protein J7501_16910, partial [Bdellovibrio sp.]|nr:hypothetical protein [Bdellovibrio sp.]